jgi:hypothetical protein
MLLDLVRGLLAPETIMSTFRHENEKGAGPEPPTRRTGGRLSPGTSIIAIAVLSAVSWAILVLFALVLYAVL